MNEEIEAATKRVLKAMEAFEESKTLGTAHQLEFMLTCLKLLLTPQTFDQLPAFSRALKEASAFIDKWNITNKEAK